ncbi:Gfo/Idh/MocA family oxidoreductase [Halomonas sp. DP8Y7-1]|uniref:Gfo/Idh/MocA family protein n=1 Tax=Halomonas sp. DP8Y7-1 TaxID=2859078 RepID=UPI001C9453C6|nr:Gfo/Idh/MocA family oxidoreductase [Halomonas sp. DP8Y7-1]MBY6030187.1 Gfo/Idh/MocA family oxidoreductase [Halomonas sp. DP8Y7-1]
MGPIRIGVMGAGIIGREHVALVQASADATLAAIADVTDAGRAFADGLGVPCYTDYLQMLDQVELDAVIVALPNALHVEAGLACIERGLPTLMEKPIADTVAGALALADASEAAGVPMLVGHHRRHSPDMVESLRAIQAGELGQLVTISGMWLCRKDEPYFDQAWRREAGGGPILINLIHEIDCLRFLCGEIESVQAVTANKARGFEVEDSVALILSFANGMIGSFVGSDAVPSPYIWDVASGQSPNFLHEPGDCYVIGGTRGSLSVPGMALWRHAGQGHWREPLMRERLQPPRSHCYPEQLRHFIAVVRKEAEPRVSAREGAMTLAATLAVDKAARQGGRVLVSEMLTS